MSEAKLAEPAGDPLREIRVPDSMPQSDAPAIQSANPAAKRPLWIWIAGGLVLVLLLTKIIPSVVTALKTVSTDDAYVNGHVTFVVPRVPGQIVRVLVDDNNRVRKGNLLVQLDKEPYRVQVDIAQAALTVAQADLVTAQAKVRGLEGLARSQRFDLTHTMEDLHNQVGDLHAKVATLQAANATFAKAQADYQREQQLLQQQVIAQQEFDSYLETYAVAKAQADKAQQDVYRIRAGLGLPPNPGKGENLESVPANLDQTYSAVKEAQARLMQTAAPLGVVQSFDDSPDQMLAKFYQRDPAGNIDNIFAQLLKDAPDVNQAEAKLSAADAFGAVSPVSRWEPDRRWRCYRQRMQRGTSSRSSSACRCEST